MIVTFLVLTVVTDNLKRQAMSEGLSLDDILFPQLPKKGLVVINSLKGVPLLVVPMK